ncbi:MAG: shikimate dehydrogenase [Nitratireductor sp.]
MKAFVAGWPVSHSLSPFLHGFWLQRHAIAGSYEAVACEPDGFRGFLRNFPSNGWIGGNITIPHKEAALLACDQVDETARAIGAVNTVWLQNGFIHGTNTDSHGFSANLDQHAPRWKSGRTAVVLGAGGASRAVIHALATNGYNNISLVNRTVEKAEKIAREFGSHIVPRQWDDLGKLMQDADIVVNTTSLGMKGQPELEIDLNSVKTGSIVTDIVYTPLMTPFLKAAAKAGLETVDGLGMLLHQAVPGFEKWFGIRPQVDAELRDHLLKILAAREAGR